MWKSPDNLWSIYCPVDAECNCPALQQSGPSYRSFSSDLLKLQQNVVAASLKLMQYFLSHLSSSYEFVFWGSRNKSKWCTITVTATLHGLLEIVTTVTSFHRNNGRYGGNLISVVGDDQSHLDDIVTMIRMTLIRLIRVWWRPPVMTSEILKCVICDMIQYVAHNPNISRPISVKLLEENQISLGTDRVIVQKIICREGPDRIYLRIWALHCSFPPVVMLWLCCDTQAPVSGVMVTVRLRPSHVSSHPGSVPVCQVGEGVLDQYLLRCCDSVLLRLIASSH